MMPTGFWGLFIAQNLDTLVVGGIYTLCILWVGYRIGRWRGHYPEDAAARGFSMTKILLALAFIILLAAVAFYVTT